jgi:hypothetical protein
MAPRIAMLLEHVPLRSIAAAPALVALVTAARVARADEPPAPELVVVADPKFGEEGGVRTVRSVGHLLFEYEQALPRFAEIDEATALGKTAAVAGRALKLTLLDYPLASTQAVVVHEVFGHGSRARELGASPTYTFRLPEPYAAILSPGDPDGRVGGEYHDVYLPPVQDLVVRLGGVESGYLMAWWIDAEATAARGWIRHDDLLVYASAKVVYMHDLFGSSLERAGASATDSDMAAYVTDLQARFGRETPADRVAMVHKLRAAYIWNLADPTLLYAAYGTAVDSLWNGRRYSRLPLPTVAGTDVYVVPRFGFSPFGAEHYVDVFASRAGVLVDVYGRAGSSGLASYTGGGVRVLGWRPVRAVSLGGEVDVWNQPAVLPGGAGGGIGELGTPAPRPTNDSPGVNAGVFARLAVLGKIGVTGKIAYKTSGYLMGEPVGDGVYGYVGLSVEP